MPEREPNRAVREYVESDGPREWEHKEPARGLYEWADVFRFYFFSAGKPGDYALPQPLVAVAPMRIETLAAYRLVPNPNGLPYEVIMNSHWLKRPQWEILETLLHEMVHLYQENAPGMVRCKPPYHNQQFVDLCEQLGLHSRLGSGAHWKPADGQFEALMTRYGVEKPVYAIVIGPDGPKKKYWWDDDRSRRKGSSTLLKYVCGCPAPKNSVRSGRKDLMALCLICNETFRAERAQ